LVLSTRRELAADALAAGIVDPHDLADALIRLDRAAELVEFNASPTTEPLYTVSPFDHTDPVARMFVTHPPLADRVARLRVCIRTERYASRPEAGFAGREARCAPRRELQKKGDGGGNM